MGGAARGADVGDLAVDETLIAELLPTGHLGPGERGAVEHLRGAFALQADRALGDGQLLRAVHVTLVVAQAGRTELDRRGIGHIGRRKRTGVGRPVLAVKAVLDGHRILRRDRRGGGLRRKRLAVVDLEGGAAAQRDLPLRLCRGHLQRPDGIGAVDVVAFLRGLVERDGVCIRAGARIGLAAGHGKRRLLAVDQADDLTGRRQRGAVVDLEGPFGHDMVFGGRDLDGAGLLLDIQLASDVLALSVDDDQLVDRSGHARLIGRIGCRGVGVRGLHRIALGQAGHGHVDAVGLAVVDAGIAAGRRDHAAGELGDGQLANGFGDRVVRLLGGGARRRPVDGVGVVARAHLGLGAGGLEGRGLAVDEAGDSAGGGQGVAVVNPGGARRAHRQRRGRDAVRALDAAGVVALAGDGHLDVPRHVGEVIGAVGHRVVDALRQELLHVLHLGRPFVLLAVVNQIARAGNRHVGGGDDVLRDDGQLALALLDGEVAGLETVLPGVGDGIGNLALGHRHDPADRLQVIDLAAEQGLGALDRHRVIGLIRAVVHELARVGRKLHGSRRDLVLPRNEAGVVADARNGHLDGARHVGEVIGAVSHRVIAALDERVAVLAGDHGNPLMFVRVVNGVARSVDLHPGIRARNRVVRVDGLRAHRQRAVPIGDVVVLHLRAVVAGLCGEGVLAGAHGGLEAEEVVAELLAGSKRTVLHADLVLGERGAVVDLGGVAGDKRHRTLGHDERGLAGRHVAELVGDVLAGGVRDDIGINLCCGVPGVGDGALGLGRKGEARGHADHVDSGAFEGRAVIDLGAALRDNHDTGHALGDLKRAEVLLDRVVRRLRATVPNQLVAVFARADGGLASGGLEGGRLAVHEAGRLALGRQRIAVIGLGGARGGHGQLRRLDLDGAVDELDVQLRGDVLALGVLDDEHVGRGRNLAVGDARRRRAGRGGLERVALGQGADRHGSAVGRAVVGERAARGGHDHLIGGLGDGQLADGFGLKPVVRPLRRSVPLDLVGVIARADLDLAADQL